MPHWTNLSGLISPGIKQLQAYQPGKPTDELERELGLKRIVKLASNENPSGPSPLVREVIASACGEMHRYPDGGGHSLKNALANNHGVSSDQITLGNGSSDLLDLIARVFLAPSTEAVVAQHAFAMYALVTQATGAKARIAPASDGVGGTHYGHDLSAMAAQIDNSTRLVFVANPNNPTGTYLSGPALEKFIAELPSGVICIVDEAYYEYVETDDYPNAINWLPKFPNLIVTRTFSKAFGLAGLRCGYSVCSAEIAEFLNRVRQPFNVNSLAMLAAETALRDDEYLSRSKQTNAAGLKQLEAGLANCGLSIMPSVANFVCVDMGASAAEIYNKLLHKGVIVRPVANYELPTHLRVTVGLESENTIFLDALDAVLEK